ncbi:hypothetical protein NC651_034358 [Populus alba x Populus x berolinensis]|nr:hypothetical protein NC651_034358 [Populus alba x Populus x berolinensis]
MVNIYPEINWPYYIVGKLIGYLSLRRLGPPGKEPCNVGWKLLDVGDGKTAEHRECSREKLRHERNTYLELVSKSKVAESIMSLVLRSVSNTEKDINNNQREHGRADGFNQQASKSEAVESPASLIVRSESDPKKYINNNQREPDRADGFDQQASNSEAVESPASFVPRKQRSSTIIRVEDDINNNQREPDRADGFDQQASNSEAVQSPASLMHGRQGSSTTSRVVDDLNYNQREHDRADGFDQQASISEAVQSPAPLMHGRQGSLSWPSPSSTIFRVEAHINNNQPAHNGPDQPAHNGPADGLNRKEQDLWRRIFYAMTLLFEIATAVLDYLSSQQSQPRYALSETVDSTLIVNGTSSSQEEAEISATDSWSPSPERVDAATRIKKHYRGFRTRRNLADSIIAAELLWQTTLSDIQKMGPVPSVNIESEKHIGLLLKWAETRVEKYGNLSSDQLALLHCLETMDPLLRYSDQNSLFFYLIWGDHFFSGSWKFDSYKIGDLKRGESLFTTGKPTSVELRMDTTSSTQHGISDLTRAWKTWKGALQQWLEVIDPRHRVGHHLNFYFQIWMTVGSGQPFFYWLDAGDGKTVDHLACSREKLRQKRNTYLEPASNLETVESLASLVPRSNNQGEHDKNNKRAHNGPADGFNQKDLWRRIFYAMNLLFEIATAVLDYLSSQQRQPLYALSGMILSITVMAISLIQLAHTVVKEGVSLQWKGWIPRFHHPVQVVELLFSVSQCVSAIIAYHYLSRDQNNPAQFCIYPVVFAFCLLCLSFRRREP